MPDFSQLTPLMTNLHQEFVRIYYMMLPLFFALAVLVQWFRSSGNGVDFVDILKRAVISTLLLVAFPDISRAIIFIADGIAERIDAHNNLEMIIKMAEEKTDSYSFSATSVLLAFDDLIIASLSFLSFIVLYIARYLNIAMYHFFWIFLTITSPLLLLFGLFGSTQQIAGNLFRGMIEVASWKIVWSVLGAMLASLSLGKMYLIEGNYVTLIVMNFVIAIAMLATPMVVRSLLGSGVQAMSATLGPATAAAMIATPARAALVAAKAKQGVAFGRSSVSGFIERRREAEKKRRAMYRY